MASEENREYITEVLFDIREIHKIHTIYNPKVGMYYYKDGIYIEDPDEAWLRHFIRSCHQEIDIRNLDEVVERIKIDSYVEFSVINENKDIISLNNCNFNLETNEAESFSPDIINTARIYVNYDKKAGCPIFEKYLKECTSNRNIPIVEELLGFILSKDYEHKYMFIIQGGADSGKSTLIGVIKRMLGNNVSNIPPQTLVNNDFAVAELYGKLANTSGDISSNLIKDTSILKQLIGSDDMLGNKKYGSMFSFKNYAKIIFACNTLPAVPDSELDLFLMKIILIKFPHTIPKSKQDHGLLAKMTTPTELSGILNIALEGRKRLKTQNDFSNKLNKDEMLEEFNSSSDPVVRFIRDVIEIDVTKVTIKDDILKAFDEYCTFKKIKYPSAKNTFWKTFKSALPKDGIDYNRQVGSKGKSQYAIGGVSLRNLSEIETEENNIKSTENIPDIKTPEQPKYEFPAPFNENEIIYNDIATPIPEPEILTPEEIAKLNYAEEQQDLAEKQHEMEMEKDPDRIKANEKHDEYLQHIEDLSKTYEEE